MSVVDLVIAVVVALAALQGYRLGALVQLCSFGGFWAGLTLGAVVSSRTVRWAHDPSWRTSVALATMLGVAVVCALAGRAVGSVVSRRLHRGPVGVLDSVLGTLVAVVATLLATWILANTLVGSPSLGLNSAIGRSGVVRGLDAVLPPPPDVFAEVSGYLSSQGFPSVFAQLAPEAAGPVSVADDDAVRRAVAAAGPSVVKIVGQGCGQIQEGSGFVVAPGVVVTNAHVVAGIPHPVVEDPAGVHPTTVVSFDPEYDLAVLRVGGLDEHPLALDPGTVGRGTRAAVLGYPEGGPFTAGGAGVMAEFAAEGRDIYDRGLTVRDVYQVQAVVRPGNSGGPLVEPDGTVIGVVFSRSTTDGDVGYALTSPGVLVRVERAVRDVAAVGTGPCSPE